MAAACVRRQARPWKPQVEPIRWFRRAAHRINFFLEMTPEPLLKDICGTLQEQSKDFQTRL
jgi:hypothetical protein